MNSKQVRAALCGLSPEEQDILQDEYSISARVPGVGPGVTEEMKTHAIGWLYGNTPEDTSVYKYASHKHTKPEKQRAKEIAKRRKNNRNKKNASKEIRRIWKSS